MIRHRCGPIISIPSQLRKEPLHRSARWRSFAQSAALCLDPNIQPLWQSWQEYGKFMKVWRVPKWPLILLGQWSTKVSLIYNSSRHDFVWHFLRDLMIKFRLTPLISYFCVVFRSMASTDHIDIGSFQNITIKRLVSLGKQFSLFPSVFGLATEQWTIGTREFDLSRTFCSGDAYKKND